MRTRSKAAALAAGLTLASTSLLVTTTAAQADHLNYVAPTEAELRYGYQPVEVASEEAAVEEAPVEEAPVEEAPVEEAPVEEVAADADPVDPGGDPWLSEAMAALRQCESGGDYTANTGNGYYGAYQFDPLTWWGLGYSGWPDEAPPWVQDEAAIALYNSYGWTPWPGCASALGLY